MRRLLRDPLTHFVILGLGALVLYEAVTRGAGPENEIVVARAEVDRMRASWAAQWSREPTDAELSSLIDAWVQEEILYREALALGLDRDDTIIRRRLAQKMDFLGADSGAGSGGTSEPDDETLSAYLAQNRERFRVASRVSFDQVYVSPDLRGDGTDADARALLVELRRGADASEAGDRLLLPRHQAGVSSDRVSQLFGGDFAETLESLPVGRWEGPVTSGFGLHLVYVEQREPARDPPLDEIRARVRTEWKAAQREQSLDAFRQALRERYSVRVE